MCCNQQRNFTIYSNINGTRYEIYTHSSPLIHDNFIIYKVHILGEIKRTIASYKSTESPTISLVGLYFVPRSFQIQTRQNFKIINNRNIHIVLYFGVKSSNDLIKNLSIYLIILYINKQTKLNINGSWIFTLHFCISFLFHIL